MNRLGCSGLRVEMVGLFSLRIWLGLIFLVLYFSGGQVVAG